MSVTSLGQNSPKKFPCFMVEESIILEWYEFERLEFGAANK